MGDGFGVGITIRSNNDAAERVANKDKLVKAHGKAPLLHGLDKEALLLVVGVRCATSWHAGQCILYLSTCAMV